MSAHKRPIPTAAEIRREFSSGGYWLTQTVNVRIASYFVGPSIRIGITPNQVSVLHLLLASVTSAIVVALYVNGYIVAASGIAFVGWHISYSLDYADGQLARLTNRASAEGGIIDRLCDVVRTSVIVASAWTVVNSGADIGTFGSALVSISTCMWILPTIYWGMIRTTGVELVTPHRLLLAARELKDFSLHITVVSLMLVVSPLALAAAVVTIGMVNGLAVAARLAPAVIRR